MGPLPRLQRGSSAWRGVLLVRFIKRACWPQCWRRFFSIRGRPLLQTHSCRISWTTATENCRLCCCGELRICWCLFCLWGQLVLLGSFKCCSCSSPSTLALLLSCCCFGTRFAVLPDLPETWFLCEQQQLQRYSWSWCSSRHKRRRPCSSCSARVS